MIDELVNEMRSIACKNYPFIQLFNEIESGQLNHSTAVESHEDEKNRQKMSNAFDDLAHVFRIIAAIINRRHYSTAQRGEVLICIIKYRKPPSAIRPVQDVQGCCILSSGDLSSWPAISRSS
jgi:hypothetical protein